MSKLRERYEKATPEEKARFLAKMATFLSATDDGYVAWPEQENEKQEQEIAALEEQVRFLKNMTRFLRVAEYVTCLEQENEKIKHERDVSREVFESYFGEGANVVSCFRDIVPGMLAKAPLDSRKWRLAKAYEAVADLLEAATE